MITGIRIKNAREEKHMSQSELGKLINVTGATISNYEKELRRPSNDRLIELANALEIKVEYLMGLDKNIVSENTEYSIRMSNEEIKFIMEMRKYKVVHNMVMNDPIRTALLINKKLS